MSIGLLLQLAPTTQIYCEKSGSLPPAIVIGAEPADGVISSGNYEAEPLDLIAAERLVVAATEYRDEMLRQLTTEPGRNPDKLL